MNKTVINILEELEATSGSNAKRDILQINFKNELLKKVFIAAQDPYTVYYVSKFKLPKPVSRDNGGSDLIIERFIDVILPQLSSRKVTGNASKELIEKEFGSMNDLEQKWCQRIILKNLRVGVQELSLNKVWPGLIKSFAVALAQTLKSEFTRGEGIKILDEVVYPVRVEPKLDGIRCIAVKKNGEVTLYTRSGTVLDTLPRIKETLEAAKYDNIVLDGEAMGDDWSESASVLMSRKDKKDDSNIFYNVFDALPLTDWTDQKSTIPYEDRCKIACEVVLACGDFTQNATPRVRLVPHIVAQDEEQLKQFFAKCMNDGYEGVMLKRMDAPYEWDRSKNILKLKPCVTYEGVVVGHYEGRRGTKREGQFGGFEVLLPNGIITRVGGGFNDALRASIQLDGPDTWIGRIVECEAQPDPLTKDGLTEDGKMRFPVYVRTRDESDVDPSVMEAFKVWKGISQ